MIFLLTFGNASKSAKYMNRFKCKKCLQVKERNEFPYYEIEICNMCNRSKKFWKSGVATCRVCHKIKSFSEFYKDERLINGIRKECRICDIKLAKERYHNRIRTKVKIKTCKTCGIKKPYTQEYFYNQSGKPYLRRSCKICMTAVASNRYYENKPIIKQIKQIIRRIIA